ncbi:hypothetical protein [Sphingobium chlorophenolicum]|uniref:hypothetical protein n=1 Tax=Sphingobium chlorophenolicum TaxID=46429 RepID=UPI00059E397C|nr:hypothetical protein [Sphingobium chlorophenolicum]
MRALLQILFVLSFAASSAFAAPFVVCQHADTKAHAAALASDDSSEVLAAEVEENAEAAAEKRGSVIDTAAGTLAAVLLPNAHLVALRLVSQPKGWFPTDPALLIGWTAPPLLDPPLR